MNLKNLHERFLQRLTLLTAGVLCVAQVSTAQPASSYSFAASAGTYTPIAGGTQLNAGIPDSWVSTAITLTPAFSFAGVSYTTAWVTSNGLVNLGGATAPGTTTYNAISTTTGSGISLLPFNADLQASSLAGVAPEIRFETVGNEHVFQWTDAMRYAYSDRINIQVRLNTTTGEVKFVYGGTITVGTNTARQPIIGIRTATTDYKNITVGTGAETWAAPLPGTTTTDNMRFTSTAPAKSPVAGQTYTFSPPPPCVAPTAQPTVLNLTAAPSAVTATFTAAAPAPNGYLVVRTQGAALNTNPANGTTYTAGATLGNGIIVGNFATPSYTDNNLSSATGYTYTIFSMNNLCSGGPLYLMTAPLTGSTTTLPAAAYTWNATTGTVDATLPGSWTPARTAPDVTDTLYFSNGGTSTASNLVTSTVAKIAVLNNTNITATSGATATVSVSKELTVAAGSTLQLSGSNGITLNYVAGNSPVGTIAGTLNLSGTGTCALAAANSVTTVTGTVNVTNTGSMTGTAAALFFNAGANYNLNRNGGAIPTATWNATSMINVTGVTSTSLTPPAKFGSLTWDCPGQTVAANSWSSTVDTIFGSLTIVNTGTGRIEGGNTPNIQIMGNFTQTGGTFAAGNYTSTTGIVEVFGNTSLQGGTLLLSSAASGTANYSFLAFGNFAQAAGHTINKLNSLPAAPATVVFAGTAAKTVNVAGTVTSNINFTLDNAAGATLTGIIPINQDAVNTVTNGAWSGTGSFTYNSTASTLAYNGTGAQTSTVFEYPAASGPTNLTLNKTAGTVLTMPFSRTVPGTLTLTNGDIDLTTNTLTLGTSAAAPGTIAGTGGRIRVTTGSFVRWYGTTGLPTAAGTGVGYYPLATSTGSNRTVSLYFDNATALTTGGTIAVSHNNATGFTTGLTVADGAYTINRRTNGSWSFTVANGAVLGGANSVAMRLTGGDMFGTFTAADLRVMQPNAVVGTHVAGGGTSPNFQASRSTLSLANLGATPFHIGAATPHIFPLAIKLNEITAANAGQRNRVNWSTATEAKADIFELERSADGRAFEIVATINAKGAASDYTYWDEQPVQGANYYRLKMMDASGNFNYSSVVSAVVKTAGDAVVTVYPNPVGDKLTVTASGNANAQVLITDISGKVVRSTMMMGGKAEIDMSGLGFGLYMVQYKNGDQVETIKITKQ